MKFLGSHSLIEAYGCDARILDDVALIEQRLNDAVRVSGATAISSNFHQFNPHGVSGVVIIAESHFTIHTWPEYSYAALDVFTCGHQIRQEEALNYIKDALKAERIEHHMVKRGSMENFVDNMVAPGKGTL